MAEQLDPNEFVSYKEALLSQIFTLDALIILLERKGLITKESAPGEAVLHYLDGSLICEQPNPHQHGHNK